MLLIYGVTKILKVGGLMSYNTTFKESTKVYKIFGPGNQYVTVVSS
jgi:histidinol dehydrogenase